MTKRFIHYDENEDGTITFTTNVLGDDEEITAVISLDIDEMLHGMLGSVDLDRTEKFVKENMVKIPNDLEDV